jgi:uncharacterized protein YhfF
MPTLDILDMTSEPRPTHISSPATPSNYSNNPTEAGKGFWPGTTTPVDPLAFQSPDPVGPILTAGPPYDTSTAAFSAEVAAWVAAAVLAGFLDRAKYWTGDLGNYRGAAGSSSAGILDLALQGDLAPIAHGASSATMGFEVISRLDIEVASHSTASVLNLGFSWGIKAEAISSSTAQILGLEADAYLSIHAAGGSTAAVTSFSSQSLLELIVHGASSATAHLAAIYTITPDPSVGTGKAFMIYGSTEHQTVSVNAKSIRLADRLLDQILRGTWYNSPQYLYLTLLKDNPGEVGSLTGEVHAPSYRRPQVLFIASPIVKNGNRVSVTNSTAVVFPVAEESWGEVGYWAITDSDTNVHDTVLFYGSFSRPTDINEGSSLVFPKASVVIEEE